MQQVNRITILLALVVVTMQLFSFDAAAVKKRTKRAAYALPDGIEFYVDNIRTTFTCPGDGYYGDIDNNCQLFHICTTYTFPDGKREQDQHTFACGNQTVFDQFSLTCNYPENAVPCASSPDFYYLNELLYAGPEAILHSEQDVERASQYGSRISGRTGRQTNSARANRELEQGKK